ncbi:Siderophore synthetase component [Alteribacillus persepolensis]|uniref:Siderophore synthetase component n=1 Tax=Alteribacillus persepolensis TaxID=568899 RepID=A0A1G8FNK7_9BACI|nr:IucA/IucC family siderophore biosynthesis protein [Alteribacillus persepolensis]SDH83669.1 Siderophore synthetase component [Alteribacillus persepolensis]
MKHTAEIAQSLTSEAWETANQRLVAKMMQEFIYEDMIQPEEVTKNGKQIEFELVLSPNIFYRFRAEKRLFDSYTVYSNSIVKKVSNQRESVSAREFLLELQPVLAMDSVTVGHLLKEYEQTLLADCHFLKNERTVRQVEKMDYMDLEGEMTGHPWITYNKGRLGFNYSDYLQFAPEQKKPVSLYWIAVHKDIAQGQHLENMNFSFVKEEMGEALWNEACRTLACQTNRDVNQFYFLPVHPWQWENVIIQRFAEEIADKSIIPLGKGEDEYLPQQSIRTFVNKTDQKKYHVKLPISILNTLVYRGLPGERTVIAPRVTNFIKTIWENDHYLKNTCRLHLLGEEASVHVTHPAYDKVEGIPYQYKEMLGVIWRESIYNVVAGNEQPITLAALLYEDQNGDTLTEHWIQQSGLSAAEWVKQLHAAILPPLLHYLYQYGIVFSPHGQNTVLVLENGQPKRLVMKDFVDDVNISDQPLPELQGIDSNVKNVLRSEPPEGLTQFIFTGLFICHYRYLADLLARKGLVTEKDFWFYVRKEILHYQEQFPELADRFELFDLFKPKMSKLCLNRNRMLAEGYGDRNDRPHASEYGKVTNALAFLHNE